MTISVVDGGSIQASYHVAGTVYRDASANGQRDADENGTDVEWWVKLTPRSGGSCRGPALQAVHLTGASKTSGAYKFAPVRPGGYCVLVDDNGTLSDIRPNTPGWIPTAPTNAQLAVTVVNSDLDSRDFGLFRGLIVSGRAFRDTGSPAAKPGASANNGVPDGAAETGLAGIAVRAGSGGSRYATAVIDGSSGAYTLVIPDAADGGPAAGRNVWIAKSGGAGFIPTGASVSGTALGASTSVDGTVYSYDRSTDTVSFTLDKQTRIAPLDFGAVPDGRLSTDGNLSGTPGATLMFPHAFSAGTAGSVRFSIAAAPAPAIAGWGDMLYRDTNCDGQIDAANDAVIGPDDSIEVVAGQQLCLVHKQLIPAGVTGASRNAVTVRADFSYANAQPALNAHYTRTDLTTVGQGGLALNKEVRRTSAACVPLPSPVGDWASGNQAQPGEHLEYRVTYRNNNADVLRNLVINDSTPVFTRFVSASCGSTPAGLTCTAPSAAASPPSAPAVGQFGIIRWMFQDQSGASGKLAPGATGNVSFCVQMEP